MAMLNRYYMKNGKCLGRARLTINRGKISEMPQMVCHAYQMVLEDESWVCTELTECGTPGCTQLCTPGRQVPLDHIAKLFCNKDGEECFASGILRVYYEADDGGEEPWMRVWGFLTHGQKAQSNPLISLQPRLLTENSCNTDVSGALLPPEKRTEYMG